MFGYGVFVVWYAANSIVTQPVLKLGALVAILTIVLFGVIILTVAAVQFARRLRARKIRRELGALDNLTVEGFRAFFADVRAALRSRKVARKPMT